MDVSSISVLIVVVFLIPFALGLWLRLPGYAKPQLDLELFRLGKRQQSDSGRLSQPPALIRYTSNLWLHRCYGFTPSAINVALWYGVGFRSIGAWLVVLFVEFVVIYIVQGFRRYHYARDSYLYLQRTDPKNRIFVGYIIIQDVGSGDEFGAANQGRMITAKDTDGNRWGFFVCVPYDEEYDVCSYRTNDLVRVFYEPLSLATRRYFPDGVDGVLIGIERCVPAQQSAGSDDESLELERWLADRANG
ncbi:MAG: hypothetical protein WBO92_01780 [Candidatus Moraniibacteriota bacterium]